MVSVQQSFSMENEINLSVFIDFKTIFNDLVDLDMQRRRSHGSDQLSRKTLDKFMIKVIILQNTWGGYDYLFYLSSSVEDSFALKNTNSII